MSWKIDVDELRCRQELASWGKGYGAFFIPA